MGSQPIGSQPTSTAPRLLYCSVVTTCCYLPRTRPTLMADSLVRVEVTPALPRWAMKNQRLILNWLLCKCDIGCKDRHRIFTEGLAELWGWLTSVVLTISFCKYTFLIIQIKVKLRLSISVSSLPRFRVPAWWSGLHKCHLLRRCLSTLCSQKCHPHQSYFTMLRDGGKGVKHDVLWAHEDTHNMRQCEGRSISWN